MIYGVVPARSGSKSVKNKNIQTLGGKPVIAHSIEMSEKCDLINKTIFTSDSDIYIEIAKEHGYIIPVKRPSILASDTATDLDYLLHLVYKLELDIDDILVLLRPTTPMRDLKTLRAGIIHFKNKTAKFHSMRSVHKLNEPPEKMYKKDDTITNMIVPYMRKLSHENANKPKEFFNTCLCPNGYIDIIPVKTLITYKTTYGENVMSYVTEKVTEIDSQDDFDYLEYRMGK